MMYRVLLSFTLSCLLSLAAVAQVHRPAPRFPSPNRPKDSLPYMHNNNLPVFNLLKLDSVEIFNTFNIPKGKPIALMLFSPDCKHCNATMELLLRGIDSISNIRFYLVSTSAVMSETKKFYDKYHLDWYPNIEVVGWDYEISYLDFFGTMHIPDVALYDADKKFIHLFEAEVTVRDLYEYSHGKR